MSERATAAAIRAGDRAALARAITTVESTRSDHRIAAERLVGELLPHTGSALRLGISGAPGVGKSTLIEALGLFLVGKGRRLAVLAVDPSSVRSGGSILGDKTRMGELARHDHVFIRPSPAGATLGGVARRTREAMVLCEAWGADVMIVETVGVGQSETAVAGMVDVFLLLASPGGGDELQGVKRGIMELADVVAVTKADGDLAAAAGRALSEYASALRLMRPPADGAPATAVSVSALDRRGIDGLWAELDRRYVEMEGSGALARRRAAHARDWMWGEVREGLVSLTHNGPAAETARRLDEAVATGALLPAAAAQQILDALGGAR